MFREQIPTGVLGNFVGPGLFLILTTVAMSADQAPLDMSDTGDTGDDLPVAYEWSATPEELDLSVPDMAYIPDSEQSLGPADAVSAGLFVEPPLAYSYTPQTAWLMNDPSLNSLDVGKPNKIRLRQKVVDWVKTRSPTAGAVTYLLVAKPGTGWHLDIDPGDEMILEWNVEF